jgi:hypothetical protein
MYLEEQGGPKLHWNDPPFVEKRKGSKGPNLDDDDDDDDGYGNWCRLRVSSGVCKFFVVYLQIYFYN